jgi:hypothetical protein
VRQAGNGAVLASPTQVRFAPRDRDMEKTTLTVLWGGSCGVVELSSAPWQLQPWGGWFRWPWSGRCMDSWPIPTRRLASCGKVGAGLTLKSWSLAHSFSSIAMRLFPVRQQV